jgi:hypothetical protein
MANTINQINFPKVFVVGPSGYIADVTSAGQLQTTGSGASGSVTSVGTAGIATGGPITTTGTVTVLGSGNTTTAVTAGASVAGAANNDVLVADGSGNAKDSGVLIGSLAPLASPAFTGNASAINITISGAQVNTPTIIAFSATPTFNAATANNFKITLTGNVTSSTLSGATAGQRIIMEIIQDGSGGHTFVWPSNMKNTMNIADQAAGANEVSLQEFYYDGTNAYALTTGMIYP